MKSRLFGLLICLLTPLAGLGGLVGGSFSIGDGSEITDLLARDDGSLFACGSLGAEAVAPKSGQVHRLLEGNFDAGRRGFVAAFSGDLNTLHWVALFPADTIAPTRIAIDEADGTLAVGGKHLGGLAALDAKGENWGKSEGAIAKLSADGTKVRWVSPGGPNQGAITGIDIDQKGRVYFSAGSRVRSAANYLLRKHGATGAGEEFVETGWCVYLHHNQAALKAPGEYLAFYDKAKASKDGFDYDGEGGWGPVRFSIQGFRIGGNVLVLPGGDVVISAGLQYDFREQGKKSFPAFDYFLARYSEDGVLRWSTNLYQPGDSVHTPDQKPIDLTYDEKTDMIYALVKQHGSNVYRFKGELVGDTGNLMISWLGKVAAQTGALQEGWYFQNNRKGNYSLNGVPKSPPYPKLAGNDLRRVRVSPHGKLILSGNAAPMMWTTPTALQAWPEDQAGGANGALLALDPNLKDVPFATCLFTDATAKAHIQGLAVTAQGMFVAGRGSFDGALAERASKAAWSDANATAAGCWLFGLMK